jgi:hypothetical protein
MGKFVVTVFTLLTSGKIIGAIGEYFFCPYSVTVSTVGPHPTNRSSILRTGANF